MKTAKERRDEALKAAKSILEAAKGEDRDLTSEETAQVNAYADTAEAAKQEMQAEEEALKAAGRVAALSDEAAKSTRKVPPTAGAESTVPPMTARPAVADDPKAGFATPREFMTAVMRHGQGHRADTRLRPLMATAGSDEAGEYSEAYGGVLVPAGFSPTLLTTPSEGDPVAGLVRRVPMTTPSLTLPARVDKDHSSSVSGGLIVYRAEETSAVTASRMQFAGVTLSVKDLRGISYATDAILTDSPVSFASLIADGFGDEFRSRIMQERISGLGGGQFVGVLNAACTVEVSAETGQPASTIVLENILKMLARAYKPQMFLASRTCIPQLGTLNANVGAGGTPVFVTNASDVFPMRLFGLPLAFSEHCSAVGTAGDIILCNWGEYLEGTLGGTEMAESIHVRFVNHETAFRFSMRNDGRPWWSSALTPKNGDTISPFVTLATRS